VVRAHRDAYGPWCPGWDVPPHEAHDLTADHVLGVASGGAPRGDLGVLCRACNGRKGKRIMPSSQVPSVRSRDWL
jgi:5-methylcytosine-specific restriction protein A